ncbi:unnamed protein product, partial [Polarella glacialis]
VTVSCTILAILLATWWLLTPGKETGPSCKQVAKSEQTDKEPSRAGQDDKPRAKQPPGVKQVAVTSQPKVAERTVADEGNLSGPPLEGDRPLWLLRLISTEKIFIRACGYSDHQVPQKTCDQLKRLVWRFLDDRPKVLATGCVDGQ